MMSAKTTQLPAAFSSFRHRNYKLWFSGQLISVIGTWMQIIAQAWLVYEISHSEFALGLVSFASAIPVLFVSPFGGVITDRVPKRTLLVITQSSAMVLAFMLSLLAFTHLVQVWHIIVLASILGIVNAFDAPARQAMVVEMVGREDLPNAIALNSITFNGARVIGPAIGGLLLAALGAAWCFFLNGISYLAVIAGLVAMTFPPRSQQQANAHPIRQIVEGIEYARVHHEILSLLLLTLVFSMFGTTYTAILPAFVDQVLHSNATGYGTVNAFIGFGAVIAAFFLAQFSTRNIRGMTLTVANLLYPFVLAAFAFNSRFLAALLLSLLLGFGFMLVLNNVNSLLQLRVSDQMRGRIMSLYTICFFGFSPFGSLAIGAVAQWLPMGETLALSAAVTFVLSLIVYLKSPEIPRLE